jgi:hypothetical protein
MVLLQRLPDIFSGSLQPNKHQSADHSRRICVSRLPPHIAPEKTKSTESAVWRAGPRGEDSKVKSVPENERGRRKGRLEARAWPPRSRVGLEVGWVEMGWEEGLRPLEDPKKYGQKATPSPVQICWAGYHQARETQIWAGVITYLLILVNS